MKGLGIDLCEIKRIERAIAGDSFLQRYFTPEEQEYIRSRGKMGAESAAAMFAAKEAFLKALGVGIGGGVALNCVGVAHAPGGAPEYALVGAALEALRACGAARAFLSLTHEGGVAAAVCVIE